MRRAADSRPYEWRNPLGRAGEGTRPYEMGESSGFAVGADDLGGPRAHTVRPYSGKRPQDVGSANSGAEVGLQSL